MVLKVHSATYDSVQNKATVSFIDQPVAGADLAKHTAVTVQFPHIGNDPSEVIAAAKAILQRAINEG